MADSQESADAYWRAHHSDNKRTEIVAPTAIFIAIAYLAVFFRYKSRRVARLRLGVDDWWIGLGLISTTCYVMVYYLSMIYGTGRHMVFIEDPKAWVIITMSTQVLYIISLCNIKISILFFYDRIFGAPKPTFRYVLLAMGCFVIAYGVAGVLGSILQCVPTSSNSWKPYSNSTSLCIHYSLVFIMGVVNVVTDVGILSLPIPLVWSLRMSKSRRWQVVAVFSLGGLVCIMSIIRLHFLRPRSWDASYDLVTATTLSAIECCVGILSACLPTYRPLWRKYGYICTKRTAMASEPQFTELSLLEIAIEGSSRGGVSPRRGADGRSEESYQTK